MKILIGFLTIIVLISIACSSSTPAQTSVPGLATAQTKPIQSSNTPLSQPTNTAIPTEKPAPTNTPEPTLSPTETPVPILVYSQPIILAELNGEGGMVSDDYQLPQCWKAVFYWNVKPSSYGSASLILKFYNKADSDPMTLVNEFAMDVSPEGLKGSSLQPLKGGTYYFSSENTDESWSVKVECQDNIAPVGTGLNIQESGSIVSDNYLLSKCGKSVFSWSVEPNDNNTASLILYLCDMNDCQNIVNEFEMDLNAPLTGQAIQSVENGSYFLISENTQENWRLNWECKD